MTEDIRLANLRRMKDDFAFYARNCLKVLPKEGGTPVPFILNKAQTYIHSRIEEQLATTGKVRVLLLKGRQQGGSTYIQARFRWKLKHSKGKKAYVVAHEQAASDNLFKMAKRYHDNEPEDVRPVLGASNSQEIWFKALDCRYEVATAGTKEIGRSGTAQYIHASEYAFWSGAEGHWAGIGQVVPPGDGTEVIVETTGNGVNNDFAHRWRRAVAGIGEYIAVFVPWFWQDEYRATPPKGWERTEEEDELAQLHGLDDSQLCFRRSKIDDDFKGNADKFKQEYPCTPSEAFLAEKRNLVIPILRAMEAQKRVSSAIGKTVAGLDPARMGEDRTAIVVRRGRTVLAAKCYSKNDTMEVAGYAVRLLKANADIAMLFIDMIGIGAGVLDRLVELGYGNRVMGVNFGAAAGEDEQYINKRHECYGEMAEWMKHGTIPDTEEWLADVTSTAIRGYDSHGRFRLELKADVKKITGKSPDLADALALTFAEPVEDVPPPPPGAVHVPVDAVAGY